MPESGVAERIVPVEALNRTELVGPELRIGIEYRSDGAERTLALLAAPAAFDSRYFGSVPVVAVTVRIEP